MNDSANITINKHSNQWISNVENIGTLELCIVFHDPLGVYIEVQEEGVDL
jgi:hypothetical protein